MDRLDTAKGLTPLKAAIEAAETARPVSQLRQHKADSFNAEGCPRRSSSWAGSGSSAERPPIDTPKLSKISSNFGSSSYRVLLLPCEDTRLETGGITLPDLEAAQQGLEEAIEAARVPDLLEALKAAEGWVTGWLGLCKRAAGPSQASSREGEKLLAFTGLGCYIIMRISARKPPAAILLITH